MLSYEKQGLPPGRQNDNLNYLDKIQMGKKIQIVLAALAGFMATSAGAAEWNTILDNSRLKIEVDAAGALKGNNVIEAWDEEVYTKLEQANPGDFYFKSVKSLARYGCKDRTTDRLMRIYFDQDGAEIKKVSEADGSAYVVPDTLEEMKFEYLCNHKLPPETTRLIAEKKARLAAEKAAEKARLKALAKAKSKAKAKKTKLHVRKTPQPSKEYQAYLEAKRRAEAKEAQLKPAADAKPQVVVPPAAAKPATTVQPAKPAAVTKPAAAPAPVATPVKPAAVAPAPAKTTSGAAKPALSLPPPPPVVPRNP